MNTAMTKTPSPALAQARSRWQALAPRERQWVSATAVLVLAVLAWWLLLAPAVRTLRAAPAQHTQLDAQLETMQALAMEAQQLQADAATLPSAAQAQRAVQTATASLGSAARVNFAGDRATITLQGAPGAAIAPWLAQMRGNARSVPVEAHLTRDAATTPTSPASPVSLANNKLAASLAMQSGVLSAVSAAGAVPKPGTAPALPNATEVRWSGSIVLTMPTR